MIGQFWRGGDSAPGPVRFLRTLTVDICLALGGMLIAFGISLMEQQPPCPSSP